MDDRNRRKWSVATDRFGPGTAVRPRLSRRGIGGVLMVRGNPVSFTVDPVLGCLPWISLNGGRDAQSQAVRDQLNQQDEGTAASGAFAGLPDFTVNGTPLTNSGGTTGGNSGGTQGTPTGGSSSSSSSSSSGGGGPFGYVGASKTGHK